jgi:hypothetical protein
VNDGQATSNTATVAVTVTPVAPPNHAPVAGNVSVSTPQGVAVGVALLGSDVDGDTLTYAVGAAGHGTVSGVAPALTYTPAAGYSGPDSFTYTVNDGQATSNTATVTVTVTPVAPAGVAPVLDVQVSKDQKTASNKITSPTFTTQAGHELLLAFVATDGPSGSAQRITAVTGGGLTWTLVKRANATGGTTEIWQAYAASPLTAAAVNATFAKSGYDGSITVATFTGAATQVGASTANTGTSGAPTGTVTPAGAHSLIWAAGHDWTHDTAPAARTGQVFAHTFLDTRVHDSFWVQRLTAPTAGTTPVIMGDTSPTLDKWQLVAVEIPAAS